MHGRFVVMLIVTRMAVVAGTDTLTGVVLLQDPEDTREAMLITDTDAEALAGCRNLQLLAISCPTKAIDHARLLHPHPQLVSLAAPSTLGADDIRAMRGLRHLESLRIRWDYLPVLSSMAQLTSLTLSAGAPATTALIAQLHALTNLKSLNFSTNLRWSMESQFVQDPSDTVCMPGIELSQIAALTTLERLCLSGSSRVDSRALSFLSSLRGLTYLDVSACRALDEDTFISLSGLTRLCHIDASWVDRVGSCNLMSLQQLPHLHTLCLTQCTCVDDSGVVVFQSTSRC
jgi:hypothetical protein